MIWIWILAESGIQCDMVHKMVFYFFLFWFICPELVWFETWNNARKNHFRAWMNCCYEIVILFCMLRFEKKPSLYFLKQHYRLIQVNLCQKQLFLHQLTHNMTKDCLLNHKFSTCCVHKLFWMSKQTKNNLCTLHVLSLESLCTLRFLL